MVKQYKFYLTALVSWLFCLNMSRAQTIPDTSASLARPLANTPPTAAPASAPGATPTAATPASALVGAPATNAMGNVLQAPIDPSTIINIDASTSGKFEEYQSICRSREFDKVQYQAKEIIEAKQKNLQASAEKIIANGNSANVNESFTLLKGLIDNSLVAKEFEQVTILLKNRKLNSSDSNKLNGFIAYSKRNYREAKANFLKILNEDPNNEFVLNTMAEIYLAENNFFEASAIYEDLNKVKNNSYLAEMCETLVQNSLNADGEIICMMASKKFPQNPYPLIYAGITHRERQNLKRARDLFMRANNIKPTEMGNVCMAELSVLENKTDDSVKYFKLSVVQSPYSARAVLGLAWAQLKAQNYPDAMKYFKEACKINSSFEVEVRKAYKKLVDDKSPEAEKFMKMAFNCSQ